MKNLKIRLYVMYNLIFFVCLFISGCEKKEDKEIKILWSSERATGLSIPGSIAGDLSDPFEERITIRLNTSGGVAILGNFRKDGDDIIFEPLVPFTRGLQYEILLDDELVDAIKIPELVEGEALALLNIYPSQDTLPENLLKVYLKFSRAMREGVSAQNVFLLKNNRDTVRGAFLDLQPELWNEDRTMLTLWLDPGRIKRDLQPNKLLGAPLEKGEKHTLVVSEKWKDTNGVGFTKHFSKKFFVTSRDSISPDPKTWIVKFPEAGTSNALNIDVGMALDYSLLLSTLYVVDGNKDAIKGKWEIGENEKSIGFVPETSWTAGKYQLQIETRLEDLAGNNINRPFDRDVKNSKPPGTDEIVSIDFVIK